MVVSCAREPLGIFVPAGAMAEAPLPEKHLPNQKRRSLDDRIQALACVLRRSKDAGQHGCAAARLQQELRRLPAEGERRRRVEGDDPPGVLAHAGRQPARIAGGGWCGGGACAGHGSARRRMHHLRGQRRRPHPHQRRSALPGGRKLRHRGRHSAAAGHSGMAAAGGSAGRGRCRRGEERCAGRDGPEQRVGQRRRCGPQPEDPARGHRLGKLQGREGRPRCTGRTRPEGRHRPAGAERRKRRYWSGRPRRCDRPARPEGPDGRGGKGGGGGCHPRRVRRSGRCQGRRQRVGRESRCQPYSQLRRFFLGGRYGQQCQRIHLCGPDGRPRCGQQPCHQR